MARGLPYAVFLEDFLIACAISVKKSTATHVEIDKAANCIKIGFDPSWPDSAMIDLCSDGWLRGSYTVGQPTHYVLTGKGLMRAEQLADDRGENLDDLIEAYGVPVPSEPRNATGNIYNFPRQVDSPVVSVREENAPETLTLGALIHLAGRAKGMSEDIQKTLEGIQKYHFPRAKDHSEWSDRLPRIEMGRNLLRGEQVYRGLLHSFLLAPLLWLLPKITTDAEMHAEISRLSDATEKLLDD